MQFLVCALSAYDAIKSIVKGFNFLVSFLQEFLATRLIILLDITFDKLALVLCLTILKLRDDSLHLLVVVKGEF